MVLLLLLWLVVLGACGHTAPPAPRSLPTARAPVSCIEAEARPLEVVATTKPVAKVTVTGPGSWISDVRERVKTEVGAVLDRAVVDADIRRLWELGIASHVEARVTDTAAGLELELALSPPPRIVRIVGAEHPSVALLRPLEGSIYEPPRLQRLAALAQRRLRAHGFARATVRATAAVTCGLATVTFAVTPGRRYKLAAFVVEGSALPIGKSFERALGRANVVGGLLRYEDLVEEAARLIETHKDRGWVEARAPEPVLTYDDARGLVSVRLEVKPGPRYRFGALSVVGGSPQARARVEELLRPLRAANFDREAYRETEWRIRDEMHALGLATSFLMVPKDHTIGFEIELELEPEQR